jgi:cysteinyl-tRNA synthetase
MDPLQIYNTLSRRKEEFEPLNPPFVGMYVCGPTVYGDAHLGNARPAITFDIVFRYLRFLGYRVRYVRNITDVGHLENDADEGEDKLLKKARVMELEPMEVAQFYMDRYSEIMRELNVLRPSIEPRATGHIPEQIDMIRKILENGFAYEVNGSVYFDVPAYSKKFKYGELSGRNLDELMSGSRENLEGLEEKRHPADFALWKKASPSHIMQWESPWSVGYPGWHLECSVMSTKYLGSKYDIHGGGLDLIFPHHEAEIAQSNGCNHAEGFTDYGEAKYWIHNNMITMNGQKMSKSLGNSVNVEEFITGKHELLEKAYSPMTLRFFMLQAHYRSTVDFSNPALQAAEKALKRLNEGLERLLHISGADRVIAVNEEFESNLGSFLADVKGFMNDDLNTARAIARMFDALPVINQLYQERSAKLAVKPETLKRFQDEFRIVFSDILGLIPEGAGSGDHEKLEGVMSVVTEVRNKARTEKNFQMSDFIRDELGKLNIRLKDTPEGTEWHYEE